MSDLSHAPAERLHLTAFEELIGPGAVISSPGDLAPWLHEARGLYPVAALAVLRPANTGEVAKLLAYCNSHRIGVVPLGGNTGLVGGTAAQAGQVLLSLDRLKTIRAVDPMNATITVDAGCILQNVQQAALEAGLFLPLSLAAEGSAMIGGVLATNAGGINVLRYGNARDFCLGIEAVTAGGEVLEGLDGLRKNNTGYDLKNLLIGSEGTLAVITGAVLRLHPQPRSLVTVFAGVPSPEAALGLYNLVRGTFGDQVSAFEFISAGALDILETHMPDRRSPLAGRHGALVLFEIATISEDPDLSGRAEACLAEAFEAGLVEDATLAASLSQRARLWALRESLPEAQKLAGIDIKHDVAVPVSRLAAFVAEGQAAADRVLPGIASAPFGHFGDGNLHFNFGPPPGMSRESFLAAAPAVHEAVISVCESFGGTFSAEHGVGRSKRDELARRKGPVALQMMRAIKTALDPHGILNPGTIL